MPDNVRVSRLLDMMIAHVCFGRHLKATLIGQYLRRQFGFHIKPNYVPSLGRHR